MSALVLFIQHSGGKIAKASLAALTAANELARTWKKDSVVGVALGLGASAAADEALHYGLAKALFSEAPVFEKYLAAPYTRAAKKALEQAGADTFVAAATSTGKDFAPRLAALLDAGQASEIIGVLDDGSLKRPTYAGNAFADVQIKTAARVVTVRATAFAPAARGAKGGSKEELSGEFGGASDGEVVSYELSGGSRPELGDAEVVVSGGRALQSAENFQKYMFPLADSLGAAVGASRAAVDSGYAPNDWQVGQTGKVVAPTLYLAVGISGAIQHLAGMKDSKVIAAVNKDPDAPIFEVADYGLVADLFQAVPALTEAIKKVKAG